MAGKSNKTVQPEDVLRSVFMAGILEMKRADVEVRIGNTDKYGGGLVLSIPAWRLCSTCEEVVPASAMATANECKLCAAENDHVSALAQGEVSSETQ